MAILKFTFAACLLIGAIGAQEWVPGIPVASRRSRAVFVDKISACAMSGDKVVCNTDGVPDSCDGNMVYHCGTSVSKGPDVLCGGPAPYCVADANGDNAVCSANLPASCPPAPSNFVCTGLGIFPDPSDCKKFYNCYSLTVNGVTSTVPQTFTCPNLYVFDPSGPKNPDYCRLTNNLFCTVSGCGVNDIKNVLLSYPYFLPINGQYIATCQKTYPTIVTFCPPNYDADVSTLPPTCRMTCKNPYGKNRVIGTTNQYFTCVWNGLSYTPFIQSCPIPKIFSTTVNDCV